MYFVFLFFSELFILFILSRLLTRSLSSLFYRLSKNPKITIYLMAFLFFPGTLLHELAHYLMAKLLFVPTYRIEFFPKLEGQNLKLGSVSIAKTDFFRRLLIGTAPFLLGTSILLATLFYGTKNELFTNPLFGLLLGYIIFEVGNTMFSSKKDMEGALELLLALGLIIFVFYLVGFRPPVVNPDLLVGNKMVKQIFEKGTLFLLAPIGLDTLIILLQKLINK
jgi:hypothetical protein